MEDEEINNNTSSFLTKPNGGLRTLRNTKDNDAMKPKRKEGNG